MAGRADVIACSGDKPVVLFLCVHNAGRSQMAAGFMRHLAGDTIDVLSGGSLPADRINPTAVEAMAERGIDIMSDTPRRWQDADLRMADVVVSMGCGDECPYVPGTIREDWPLDDPAGQAVEAVRPIRDEIEQRVRDLMRRLGSSPRAGTVDP